MTVMLKLSDKDFKAASIKMLQWAITDILQTNEESQQRNKTDEEELNWNFKTEKKKTHWKMSLDEFYSKMNLKKE